MGSRFYSWYNFVEDLEGIEKFISENTFESFLGIGFGGLPLTTKLKNTFNISTQVLIASSYNNEERKKEGNLFIHFTDIELPKGPILIIDDIADTGDTLTRVTEYLKGYGIEYKILTLFYKERSIIKPDYYSHKVSNDIWIKFAWE